MNKKDYGSSSFNWFIEALFWIKTFLSPLIGGMFIGVIFLFSIDTPIGVSLFWVCTALGIVFGITLATGNMKKQGNAEFHKGIMASPDMNAFDEEKTINTSENNV